MRSHRLLKAAMIAGSIAVGAPAHADELVSQHKIDIAVSGSINQYCALGSIGDMDFGNLERRGLGAEARVAFKCNLPFTMTIQGQNGGLAHTMMPAGQGPYGGTVPYSLDVQMPVRHPSTQMISRSFASRQLQSGGTLSSNGGIAADGMLLTVALGTPSGEAGLLAGEYTETITITVSPS
jgi:spore coat protein U-like protein